jgi:hypothetical protein
MPLLFIGLGGCAVSAVDQPQQEATGQAQENLFVRTGVQTWNQTVPVCFHQSPLLKNDHTREMNMIRHAIERTWARYANFTLTWNGLCTNSGGSQLRINLGPHTQEDGSSDGQTQYEGMANLTPASTPLDVDADKNIFHNPGIRLWIQDDWGSQLSRLEYCAIHEFGHALGFAHEQDSFANPNKTSGCTGLGYSGHQYGPWDQDSIMNYCADTEHGYLSDGDREGATDIYGFRSATGVFSADVNGDGKADIVDVTDAAIYVLLSDGTKYNWSGAWTTGPMVGTRETIIADVNGDHKADAIAVNRLGVFVMLSDGTKFNWSGQWSNPFVGTRRTIAADVNGDGKMDLIAVNNGGNFVVTSDGTKFNWDGQWSGPLFGSRATWAGDVNKDGKADLVTMSIYGWQVAPSTGSAFTMPPAATGYGANSRAVAIADANGDGFADYVATNDWGVDVLLSNGKGFGSRAWTTAPFFGARESLLADASGDGKVDAIAVNANTIYVAKSTGSSFGAATEWYTQSLP